MNQRLPYVRVLFTVITLFFTLHSFAQLPPFNFTVSVTDQTCLNNGVLTFTTSGTQAGAGITFTVYKLPDTINYVIETTNTVVPGRSAGNYRIVATQSLNGQVITNTQDVVIANLIAPLDFVLIAKSALCGNDGAITVTTISGYPASYEIIEGPVLRPLQSSNIFSGLPTGLYRVRVFDICGEGDPKEVLVQQATPGLSIGVISDIEYLNCNDLIVTQDFFPPTGTQIAYPIYIQITVYPPGGAAPVVLNQVVTGGSTFPLNIPYYPGNYTYDIKATDSCGRVYNKTSNGLTAVNKDLALSVDRQEEDCGDNYFIIRPENFTPPYTLSFPTAPDGFNPLLINPDHPEFITNEAVYGGNGVYVPEGPYVVNIIDGCLRTATLSFTIVDIPIEPAVAETDADCNDPNGSISITIPGREITEIKMNSGPNPPYSGFPIDMSSDVDSEGEFTLDPAPQGQYLFFVKDSCDDEYLVEAEIGVANAVQTLSVSQRPGCTQGQGSVKITGTKGLGGFTITNAPPTFPTPYVGTPNIASDGAFYMNSMPGGLYTIQTVDDCGTVNTQNITVAGYNVTNNDFTVTPHCGSFDLEFLHLSNGTYVQGFYLQKFNETDNVWEHPATGVDYVEGSQATSINSVVLSNNVLIPTLSYMGRFRVLKTFFVYANGNLTNIRCTQVLREFEFENEKPVITDVYGFPCSNGTTEVAVVAQGVAPLHYAITTKDNQVFTVDNGESNVFTGLESGIYNFEVSDVCGFVRNIRLDVDSLDPLAIKADGFCEGEDSFLFVQEFSFLDYKWYKEGSPNMVLSTTGTLLFPDYESASDAGSYILEITTDNPLSCMNQILEYNLNLNAVPNAGENITAQFCNAGQSINLNNFLATGISRTGVWEDMNATGFLTSSILSGDGLAPGTYQFRYTLAGLCNQTDEALLTLEVRNKPLPPAISGTSPVCEGVDLQLTADAVGGASYAWTGPNSFSSSEQNPLIENSTENNSGTYSLTVTVNGCSSDAVEYAVTVLAAPNAGLDGISAPICNEGNALDLTDYLTGTFDVDGTWEDVDATGAVNGDMFATAGIAPGVYRFRYSVTNICNATDDALVTLELVDIPDAPTVQTVVPICEGADIQLSADAPANAIYSWSGPDGFTSAEQNPLITAAGMSANGNYIVNVRVNGCTSDAVEVPVTVRAIPQFNVVGNTALCEGQTSLLTVIPDNFDGGTVLYRWYYEGTELTEATANLQIDNTGMYQVIVDNNNCTTARDIEVVPNENPFEVVLDSGCIDYDYMLWIANIDDIQGAVVTWTGPGGFSFTGPRADITNKFPGTYNVTVTNAEGCTAEASIPIDNTTCYIPRGVSPNGDGLNDTFDLSNLDVIKLKIFNRYGLKVYEANNYLNEWYGQSDKGTLPTATYYYVVTLSAGKEVTGWVYLQREEK
ncbi:hypothetical protein AMR72_13275 [Flavobacterium psychrophilum]|nr:hypothetical protein AMR72_13275 [Flavobacterium psychrophilum]AOE53404.1 hypothetical protein ALW18_13265 [Flavobacterium psychrophilum]